MKVIVPDIGDFAEVAVIEVLIRPGDMVAAEETLIILESDKATMDVPSPAGGKITAVHVAPGDKISTGTHIADLSVAEDVAADSAEDSAESADKSQAAAADSAAPAAESQTVVAPPAAKSAMVDDAVYVPDIGDFGAVAIIEVLIKPGDVVAVEDSLLTLESDKASMDIPAPFAGIVQEIHVKIGDKISQGDLIARISPAESPAEPTAKITESPVAEQSAAAATSAAATISATSAAGAADNLRQLSPAMSLAAESKHERIKPHASPSVRKFARELGADLHKIKGGGRRGRILKIDVQNFIKAAMQSDDGGGGGGALPIVPPVDFSLFGKTELQPLSRIRKLSADNLRRNWLVAPHVTQCAEADISDMEEFRRSLAEEAQKDGYRMTPLAFFIRAAVMALRQFPDFNTSLHADGEHLVRKHYFNIGVAVDTPGGLVVPVLKDAERKGLTDIARELGELSARARAGKLKSEEMRGGCFTISSLGGIGGSFFTPIINLPEVAIMGISRSQMRPQWDGNAFVPRLILPLSLSYDHRVIDGAAGARFITYYAALLADIRRLSL